MDAAQEPPNSEEYSVCFTEASRVCTNGQAGAEPLLACLWSTNTGGERNETQFLTRQRVIS
jgi:hypothetical protein